MTHLIFWVIIMALAQTLFGTDGSENLLVPDIYSLGVGKLSAFKDRLGNITQLNGMKDKLITSDEVKGAITGVAKIRELMTTEGLNKRLRQYAGVDVSDGITGKDAAGILTAVSSSMGATGDFKVMVDGVAEVASGRWDNLSSLSKLSKTLGLADKFSFIDLDTENAILATVIGLALDAGLVALVDQLFADDEKRHRVVETFEHMLHRLIASGDYVSIGNLADKQVRINLKPEKLLNVEPDLYSKTLANDREYKYIMPDYNTKVVNIHEAFSKVGGDLWYMYRYNPTVYNATYLRDASIFVSRAMVCDPTHDQWQVTCNAFTDTELTNDQTDMGV